jgi:hypothetical protein
MASPGDRIALDAGLLALLVLAAIAVAADVAVLRPLTVALALLLVPGGALLTRLRVDDPATAAGIAIAASLAVETLVATATAALHAWEPWLLGAGLALPAALLLAVDLQRTIAARGPAGGAAA